MKIIRPAISVLAMATTFAIGTACVVYGVEASSNSVHLCAAARTGALRAASHCHPSEHAITVDRQGPIGPQGIPGLSNYRQVSANVIPTATGQTNVQVTCPNGLKVLGGGGSGAFYSGGGGDPSTVHVLTTYPVGPSTWSVDFDVPSLGVAVVAYATCAQVAP